MEETISTRVQIGAQPERVFQLLRTPQDAVNATPSQEWYNFEEKENGGYNWEYTFRMAGVPLKGDIDMVVCDEDALKLIMEYDGDLDATLILSLSETANGNTELRWETRYDLPETALSRIAAPIIRSYNTREVEACAKNIKQMMESGWEPDEE